MDEVVVRDATVDDAWNIAKVHVETWQRAYQGQIPDTYLKSLSIENKVGGWENSLKNPKTGVHTLVATIKNEVIGWCVGGVSRDDDALSKTGELHGIYVHPSFWRKGAGSALMESMLQMLKMDGYTKATLWVLDTNEKTRRWYASKGWKVEGKIKTDYRADFALNEVRYYINL